MKKKIIIGVIVIIFLSGLSLLLITLNKDKNESNKNTEEAVKVTEKVEKDESEKIDSEEKESTEEQSKTTAETVENKTNSTQSNKKTTDSSSKQTTTNTTTTNNTSSEVKQEQPKQETQTNTQTNTNINQEEVKQNSYIGVPDPNSFNYSFHHGKIEYSSMDACLSAADTILFKDTVDIINANCLEVVDGEGTVLGEYLYIKCSSGNCDKYK